MKLKMLMHIERITACKHLMKEKKKYTEMKKKDNENERKRVKCEKSLCES